MYVSFFPQLIAGPIVRYETVEQEIRSRSVTMDDLAQGFRRFVVGLAKKLLLANQVAQVATIVYNGDPANYGSLMYWLAAIAYTLQIVGQRGMNETVASLIMSLESAIAVIAGWLLLGEVLSQRELFGCVLMAGAVVLAQLPAPKSRRSGKD